MLLNYFKVALRSIRRNKFYSFINVAGLTVGIGCALLIFLYVQDELNFDRFHSKSDRIYRMYCKYYLPNDAGSESNAPIGPAIAPVVERDFPEVKYAVRIDPLNKLTFVKPDSREEFFDDLHAVDSTIFQVFDFKLLVGNPENALSAPFSIVLSEEKALKYFGTTNIIGKQLQTRSDTSFNTFTVTGIIDKIPSNSHLQFDMLTGMETMTRLGYYMENWWNFSYYTYILTEENVDPQALGEKLKKISATYIPNQESSSGYKQEYYLQAIPDIHLYSTLRGEFDGPPNGKASFIYIFIIIGVFLLLIACINFMNLATARSMQRAREVGIRKTIGATRKQLISQFMGESAFMAALAMIFAIICVLLVLPWFNDFTEKELSLNVLNNPPLLIAILVVAAFVGLVSGSYPALVLSGFNPVRVLHGRFSSTSQGRWLRKGLVVFQFCISIFLIGSTLFVFRQIDFMKETELGFAKDNTVVLEMQNQTNSRRQFRVLKEELESEKGIMGTTLSSRVPGKALNNNVVRMGWGQDAEWSDMRYISVDEDFFENYELKLLAGRFFQEDRTTDEAEAFILNESGIRRLGFESPEAAIGKKLSWQIKKGYVIGVVEDFHFMSVNQEIEPFIMVISPGNDSYLSVKIEAGELDAGLAIIQQKWGDIFPNRPFHYSLLEESFDLQYKKYERFYNFFGIFALIAIFIACLGLFGLAAFTAQTRTKEIGVRKIMGASPTSLIMLLTREFSLLVGISFLLAVPVIYFGMDYWLQDFPLRVGLTPWVFLLSGLIALAIAWLTVSYHASRAARSNPVEALKYE